MENLDKIQIAISLLSEVYYKATLNHARIFLYIAARNNEIVETRDPVSYTHLTLPTR